MTSHRGTNRMNRGTLSLSLLCIVLLLITLGLANQVETNRHTISVLQDRVNELENRGAVVEARIRPQMWTQYGSPPWRKFQYDSLPYGFHVIASDSTNGTNYVCNRAIGYFTIGAVPNHLWITGRVRFHDAAQSGQSWSRIAFVMAVDDGDSKNFLELDVHDSPNSPIQPGNPGTWPDVYESNKYQLRVGEERVFTFDIGSEYRNHYSRRAMQR